MGGGNRRRTFFKRIGRASGESGRRPPNQRFGDRHLKIQRTRHGTSRINAAVRPSNERLSRARQNKKRRTAFDSRRKIAGNVRARSRSCWKAFLLHSGKKSHARCAFPPSASARGRIATGKFWFWTMCWAFRVPPRPKFVKAYAPSCERSL